jgi:hypothetical protein
MRTLLLIIAKYIPFKKKYQLSFDFKNKIVWYRVPKAGLSSINKMMKDAVGRDYYYRSRSANIFNGWYSFAIVRNPMERFKSLYADKVVNNNYFCLAEDSRNVDTLLDLIEDGYFKKDPHVMSQNDLVPLGVNIIKIEHAIGIPHINKSNIDVALTAEQMSRIYDIYKQDFKRFYKI